MSKKSSTRVRESANEEYANTLNMYRNKYFNLYRAQFKWTGLDYRQEEFIMKKFYGQGKVAAFKIRGIDELGFADFAENTYDMYGLPETVTLVNEWNSPVVPMTTQIVDKDVCLGYIQRNKKPMNVMVDWYLKRITAIEMVITTNLTLHKMPYLIPVDEADSKVMDIVDKIINDELVVFAKGVDPMMFKAVETNAPYIIDKLCEYKATLENDLKTFLGINNQGIEKQEQLQLAEVNANNDTIMDSEKSFLDCLQEWCKNIKETLGITITVEATSNPVVVEGEVHDGDKPGPKGDDNDENME